MLSRFEEDIWVRVLIMETRRDTVGQSARARVGDLMDIIQSQGGLNQHPATLAEADESLPQICRLLWREPIE